MEKTMLHEVNHNEVNGNECSRSVGKDVESLVFLQISHAEMNLPTKAPSFGHLKSANKE